MGGRPGEGTGKRREKKEGRKREGERGMGAKGGSRGEKEADTTEGRIGEERWAARTGMEIGEGSDEG